MIETLYLTGAVLAFSLLMLTLFIVKVWSDGGPSRAPDKAEVTPARRPDPTDLNVETAA